MYVYLYKLKVVVLLHIMLCDTTGAVSGYTAVRSIWVIEYDISNTSQGTKNHDISNGTQRERENMLISITLIYINNNNIISICSK